jgi:vacuolar protein sorting-associated protein 13A/C
LVDGSLSTSIVLCDVNLDDTRPNREGKLTRYMERRERKENELEPGPSTAAAAQKDEAIRSMIDVTFQMKENDMFADVKVFSFNLVLSMDFLMKLSAFLQPDSGNKIQNSADIALEQKELETRRRRSSISGTQAQQQDAAKKSRFSVHIEEYDIILVEKMDDINCLALILNVSGFFTRKFKLIY